MRTEKISLGCDTAHFACADLEFFKKHKAFYGPVAQRMCKIIGVEPGRYEVTMGLDSWDGNVKETATINVPSGKLFVGDSCYMFSSQEPADAHWGAFMTATGGLEYVPDEYFAVATGGDGNFDIDLTIQKV